MRSLGPKNLELKRIFSTLFNRLSKIFKVFFSFLKESVLTMHLKIRFLRLEGLVRRRMARAGGDGAKNVRLAKVWNT